eukprot:scaffold320890_cov26-Tisochrysis_lutea.AAC.1
MHPLRFPCFQMGTNDGVPHFPSSKVASLRVMHVLENTATIAKEVMTEVVFDIGATCPLSYLAEGFLASCVNAWLLCPVRCVVRRVYLRH